MPLRCLLLLRHRLICFVGICLLTRLYHLRQTKQQHDYLCQELLSLYAPSLVSCSTRHSWSSQMLKGNVCGVSYVSAAGPAGHAKRWSWSKMLLP